MKRTQITNSHGNIIEKVIRDKQGKLVRARFFVYASAGRVKARIVDFAYIEVLKGTVASLSGFIKEKTVAILKNLKKFFTSPYFNTEILNLSGSKPRAPAF